MRQKKLENKEVKILKEDKFINKKSKLNLKNYIITYWDMGIGLIILMYIIGLNIINRNKMTFTIPIISLGVILILYHFFKLKIKRRSEIDNNFSKLIRGLKLCTYTGIICFLLLETLIVVYPKYDESECNYIIVLGAGLNYGKYPSDILRYRLNAAVDCFNKNENIEKIVLSGGQGSDEDISEAQAMKNYLLDMGIPDDKIMMEDKSTNTIENFKFSKSKIEENSKQSIEELNVKIITTDFHAFRSAFLAKRVGYTSVENYSSKTVWYLIPLMYVRESFAIIKSVVFD